MGEAPLEPWQDKAAPRGARGSRRRSPHSTTPSLLHRPRGTLHLLGKARGGRLKAHRNLHKAVPEVAEQQQESRDAVRPVSSTCCTCYSKVEHGCCFHFSRTQVLQREVLLSAVQASLICLSIMIPKLAFHTLASS